MSIATRDIVAREVPKRGVMRPAVEASLTMAASMAVLDIPVLPADRLDFVRKKIVTRLYGDIAQDFEDLLRVAFAGEEIPSAAAEVVERIRAKLRGDGPGEAWHCAPPNGGR